MSEARTAILARVRQGVAGGDTAERRQQAIASAAARHLGPQPVLGGEFLADSLADSPAHLLPRFRAKAESLASTTEMVATAAQAPAAIARYLAANGLGVEAVIAPKLASLDWSGAGLRVAARAAVDADTVGVTDCFCAIAETGTIMLLSSPQSPASVSLLPETHIALVPISRLVATMEEAFALQRAEFGALPRAVNLISGPSRTGDIEQTIVLGAHGPCRVHLILIET